MIREDLSDNVSMKLVFKDQTLEVPYSTFMGAVPDMTDPVVAQGIADSVRDWIYTQIDTETKLNKLPQDDLDRSTDPGTPNEFWRGNGGKKVLVARPYTVTVKWDGERFQYSIAGPV